MNFKQSLIIALPALLCGALLGYLAAPAPAPVAEPEAKAERPTRKARPTTDVAAVSRLRARVAELEKQLAATKAPATAEKPAETEEKQQAPQRPAGGPGDFRARMEEMAKNDPERFAQMTNRFAQMRNDHLRRVQGKLDLLASFDTSRMTPRQRETHEKYQEFLAQQTELRDMMRPGGGMEEMSQEERQAAFEQLRSIDEHVHRLANEERDTLLQQAALSIGIRGQAANEAAETFKAIFNATEAGMGGPGMGRGGRGGRGGR